VKFHIPEEASGFILDCQGALRSPGETRLQIKVFRSSYRYAVLALAGATLLASVSGCHRTAAPDVMATVNGKNILRSDLDKIFQANLANNAQKPTAEQADLLRLNILSNMINEEILWQRATKLNLAASDDDVNAKLTEYKAPYTPEEWDKQLQAHGITVDDYKRDLRRSLTRTKLLNKEIESRITVTDAEISSYYAAHKSEYNLIEPQYRLAQIAVSSGPVQQAGNPQAGKANGDAEAKKKIFELHKALEAGQDFSALAVKFSENPNTAPNGGDMGFIPETQLRGDQDVFSAVSKLKQGAITDVLPVYDGVGPGRRTIGYAIYKLVEREAAGQRELNDPRIQQVIRQGIHDLHQQRLQTAYFEVLHNDAKIHNYFADQILKQGAQ
jgi:peptidyl-prolyl cis-trans isomerase SurA